MKTDELKKCLKRHEKEVLEALAFELYKAIPKKVKDEKGIDGLLRTPAVKRVPKKHQTIDIAIDGLSAEIREFIDHAYKQHYLTANPYVAKDDQSQWRFVVKRVYRTLLSVTGEDMVTACNLLADLYQLLCYACDHSLFNTYEPFQSIGIGQDEFLKQTASKILAAGHTSGNIRYVLQMACIPGLAWNLTRADLMQAVLPLFTIPVDKEIALRQLDALGKSCSGDDQRNDWVVFSLLIYLDSGRHEEGIDYFITHYGSSDSETKVNDLLSCLKKCGSVQWWLKAFEDAVTQGVAIGPVLQGEYERIKEAGRFGI